MAKRARGATRRPGQRRATQRPGPRPLGGPAAAPPGLDGSAAATLEPVAAVPAETTRSASLAARSRSRQSSSAFAAESAQEYGYVVSDVRRIVIVAGGVIGVMVLLFLVIDVLGIVRI